MFFGISVWLRSGMIWYYTSDKLNGTMSGVTFQTLQPSPRTSPVWNNNPQHKEVDCTPGLYPWHRRSIQFHANALGRKTLPSRCLQCEAATYQALDRLSPEGHTTCCVQGEGQPIDWSLGNALGQRLKCPKAFPRLQKSTGLPQKGHAGLLSLLAGTKLCYLHRILGLSDHFHHQQVFLHRGTPKMYGKWLWAIMSQYQLTTDCRRFRQQCQLHIDITYSFQDSLQCCNLIRRNINSSV